MTPGFNFSRTPLIRFGPGSLSELGAIISVYGNKIALITGNTSLKTSGHYKRIESLLSSAGITHFSYSIVEEPSPELIDKIVSDLRNRAVDVVVSIGGGSVIDAGKAVSAMLKADGPVIDYLEDVGTNEHSGFKVPFIAVPTTAGTGSEATANAVLSKTGPNGFKKSLRHVNFVPDVALIDPELMTGCPPDITAACGMDAFTHLLESYVSVKASPMTDALSESGMAFVRDNLVPACSTRANDLDTRGAMAYAALMSGITLANAGVGVVHGMASVIGGHCPIPHGVICENLVGPATRATMQKLFAANPKHPALEKYAHAGYLLAGTHFNTIENGCDLLLHTIDTWTRKLNLPHLASFGFTQADIDMITAESSNKNNPIKLDNKDLRQICRNCL
jgi:Alcohol dehydrogenase, class IV